MSLFTKINFIVFVCVCLISIRAIADVPSPWLNMDIGSPSIAGSADHSGGTFTVSGSGALDDIPLGMSPDKCQYVYREVTGEFVFTTRLVSMNYPHEKAKAGVVLRLGLSPTSPQIGLVVQANGEPIKMWRWHQGGGAVIDPDCTNWPSATETCRIRIDRYFYRDFPVWLRLQKYHHQVSVFISENGTDWTLVRDQTLPVPQSKVYIGMVASDFDDSSLCEATFDNVQLDTTIPINYTTSWIGNSFEGCNIHYVQHWIGAMYVKPDTGLIYCTGWYDEGGHTAAIYSHTGEPWGGLEDMSFHTRYGMVTTDDYVYCLSQHKWTGDYESTGKPEFGNKFWIRRFNLDGSKAPFGGTDNWLLISENEYLRGIAANDTGDTVYVSDTGGNRIRLVDTTTMQIYSDWTNIYRPGPLAYDNINYPSGALWIVETRDDTHSAKIVLRDHNGQTLPVEINGIYEPRGLAVHPITGQLYVAEYGPDSQVLIYNADGSAAGSFGVQGGVYVSTTPAQTGGVATIPGEIHPLKFNHPTGVGFDFNVSGSGEVNLYVATNGPPVTHDAEGTGSMIRKFHWNDISQEWEFRWQRYGLEFVDGAFVEPGSDGLDVYTKHAHYHMDFSKTRGQEAEYVGFTLDPLTYPEDWRNREGLSNPEFTPQKEEHEDGARLRGQCAVIIRIVDGRKLMYLEDQHSTGLSIYRFESNSEIAVPAGRIAREGNDQRYIWRDMDGQGDMDWNGEMEFRPKDAGEDVWGWWVDNDGDIWTAGKTTGVRRHIFQGFDSHCNPIYHFNNMQEWAKPSEFNGGSNTELTRIVYDEQTDTMYLGGYTVSRPKTGGEWGCLGREVIRYNNWSGGRSTAWRIVLPYDPDIWDPWTGTQFHGLLCRNLAVAGDRVFVGIWADKTAKVYDKSNGQHLFDLKPGPEVGNQAGWIESPLAMSAYQRSNGEYLLFYHDEYQHKVLMFRFDGPGTEEPTRLVAQSIGASQISLTWEDHASSETSFEIERRTPGTSWEYLTSVSANTTSYTDSGLSGGVTYIYHLRAIKGGGNTSFSWEASATTPDQPPAAPTDLVVEKDLVDPLQINLAWVDHADNEAGFSIERKVSTSAFSQVGVAGSSAGTGLQVEYHDTGLLPDTTYTYRVSAFNIGGDHSNYSNEASAKTGWEPTCYTVDDTDAGITYSGSWNAQTGWGGRYNETIHETETQGDYCEFTFTGNTITLIAERISYGGEAEIFIDSVSQGTIDFNGSQPPYQVDMISIGSLPKVEHTLRMECLDTGWIYLDAIEFCITTQYTNAPAAPSGLSATAASSSQIDLSWVDNSGDNDDEEDWFKVERKTTEGGSQFGLIATLVGVSGTGNVLNYADTGLTSNTTYIYRVYASNDIGDSGYSSEESETTLPPPAPDAPANLAAMASSGRVTLSWDASTEDDPPVLYYKIYRSTVQGGPYQCVAIAFGGANIIDSNVYNGTSYYYRVTAVDTAPQESGYSNEVSATPDVIDPPTAPIDLAVIAVSESQINLFWTDTSQIETGFRVERLTDSATFFLQASSTSYVDTGLQPDTTYQYKVIAYNGAGDSPEPNPVGQATTIPVPIPQPPSALTANADSVLNVIYLDWSDNSSNEDGFVVERRTTGGFEVVHYIGSDVDNVTDSQLAWQTTYTYRVYAYNSYGDSPYSNEASDTTPDNTNPVTETIDDTDALLVYTGDWSTRSSGGHYGGSTHETDEDDAYVEFTFTGYAVELIGEKQPWGGTADVYLDDAFEQSVSFNSPVSDQFQETIFTISGLSYEEHTLKVVKTGGGWIYVDAVKYTHY